MIRSNPSYNTNIPKAAFQVKPMVDEFSEPLWKSTCARQCLLKSCAYPKIASFCRRYEWRPDDPVMLSQIATPDLQPEGDQVAVFKGLNPNELIFGTEIGLLTKEPYLLSAGVVDWSPHSQVAPQPLLEPEFPKGEGGIDGRAAIADLKR